MRRGNTGETGENERGRKSFVRGIGERSEGRRVEIGGQDRGMVRLWIPSSSEHETGRKKNNKLDQRPRQTTAGFYITINGAQE